MSERVHKAAAVYRPRAALRYMSTKVCEVALLRNKIFERGKFDMDPPPPPLVMCKYNHLNITRQEQGAQKFFLHPKMFNLDF